MAAAPAPLPVPTPTPSPEGAGADDGEDAAFRVGQRVHAAGNPRRAGTVRYVVGVDWDDGEGKHDGSLAGARYFAARGHRSASFVRPKALSPGISLIDALLLRYSGDYTKEEEEEMYVLSTSKKRVSVEFVGKNKVQEKLKHFDELLTASVSYMGVSSIGPPHEISALVPSLKDLDLTGNLISKWQEIASLCEALPSLEVLNLTNNMIESDVVELPLLKSIRILVLNSCGITWESVETLEKSLPAVEELHLMSNKLRTIVPALTVPVTSPVQRFGSLRLLNLEDNHFDEWDEILKLSHLRSLEQLYLNKNNLKHIFYPSKHPTTGLDDNNVNETSPVPFENLQCLLLGCNKIEDLASVDSLNFFPRLTDIRLSENPIVDPAIGGLPRFVLIARLAKVTTLNGSEVSPRERKESEIRYVRLVMAKMQSVDSEEIKQLHPRFEELKALHGIEDENPRSGTSGPQKMASGLISVTLKCVGASMGEKQPLTKKLPPATTVGKLKVLCESFFKLKDIKLRLFLEEEGSPLPLLLDEDMAPLMDLGIGSGATILVDEEN
ncbi:tubulin-folding cofactor E [Ananas comosus]|uniref:Tubulin-folding cofactor E n=1 Tax=Ananas comosus TaxID=4615 RepID=A0A6P5GNK4_ANACO|nr:tubulin-folding cofactor E [Ananas comosus]